MAKKKIAYTTSRLNRNLESVTANDSGIRAELEQCFAGTSIFKFQIFRLPYFKWGIFVAGLLFADD